METELGLGAEGKGGGGVIRTDPSDSEAEN